MVLVQKWPFYQVFFLGIIDKENVFYDIVERRNAFLGYKNKKFKESKNWHFWKGVNPWFSSKNGHFFNFLFLGNIGQENVYNNILEQKKRLSSLSILESVPPHDSALLREKHYSFFKSFN